MFIVWGKTIKRQKLGFVAGSKLLASDVTQGIEQLRQAV
jgi:hypothetical protein